MNYINLFLLVFIFIILIISYLYITVSIESKNYTGTLKFESLSDWNDRGLSFTKGKIYDFYKSGNFLICNSDDKSKYRDNYYFRKEVMNKYFKPVNLNSLFALKHIP